MSKKVSTCLYITKEVLETAKRVGLNLSRVTENALKEATCRMLGADPETGTTNRPVCLGSIGSPGEI